MEFIWYLIRLIWLAAKKKMTQKQSNILLHNKAAYWKKIMEKKHVTRKATLL